jgi:hypothetical protein
VPVVDLDFVSLLKDLGPGLALLAYFAWKDYKFTGQMLTLMGRVDRMLERFEAEKPNDRKGDAA